MATIDNNNLPKGVTYQENTGLYVITNSKGQTSRVNADSAAQLNTYNTSWQTGTPATVSVVDKKGNIKTTEYNPSNIIGQDQARTEYQANLTALKRADVLPNKDGTYSSRTTGAVLTDAEVQQKVAAAGLPPNTLEIQKNQGTFNPTPSPATVAASTAAVNNVNNIPSGVPPAPAPPETGTANSPLTVDPQLGATIVKEEPNPAQNAAATDETIQDKRVPAEPVGNANIQLQEQNAAANEEAIRNAGEGGTGFGLTTAKLNTQSQATQQDAVNFQAKQDWRVRLSLSPGATYLYKASPPGILAPLQATDGVIFPYTPAISVQYNANYDATELTHSNYKFFTYRGSAVDSVTIGCDFTAQDTFEAQYVLAVIHFFRSMTKMFYGQDQNPTNGTPPPLCYLSGLGAFQFDAHPLVITAFTYTLPTDVDYIQAGSNFTPAGVNTAGSESKQDPFPDAISRRLASNASNALSPGATVAPTVWQTTNSGTKEATYVPTKISLSITANPIVTRNDISNKFSLREYATGALLRGTKRAGGGIW
jgi:hypothetical protein